MDLSCDFLKSIPQILGTTCVGKSTCPCSTVSSGSHQTCWYIISPFCRIGSFLTACSRVLSQVRLRNYISSSSSRGRHWVFFISHLFGQGWPVGCTRWHVLCTWSPELIILIRLFFFVRSSWSISWACPFVIRWLKVFVWSIDLSSARPVVNWVFAISSRQRISWLRSSSYSPRLTILWPELSWTIWSYCSGLIR